MCPSEYDNSNSIEASYVYNYNYKEGGLLHNDKPYYLFVNNFYCCRDLDSTYIIKVGRSASPAGPFLDRDGKDMAQGGGTVLIDSYKGGDKFVGPGHAGILYDEATKSHVLTFDYQGVKTDSVNEEYLPQARVLTWDDDGWPEVTI